MGSSTLSDILVYAVLGLTALDLFASLTVRQPPPSGTDDRFIPLYSFEISANIGETAVAVPP
jgi:hypothetical protein